VIPIGRGEGTPKERADKRFAETQRPFGPAAARRGETDYERGVRLARERYPHLRTGPPGGGAAHTGP
jgi:hypothetical protein